MADPTDPFVRIAEALERLAYAQERAVEAVERAAAAAERAAVAAERQTGTARAARQKKPARKAPDAPVSELDQARAKAIAKASGFKIVD